MIAAWYIALLAALAPIGRWIRKHAVDLGIRDDLTFPRFIQWGRYGGVHSCPLTSYLLLRLPGASWRYFPFIDNEGWGYPYLWWCSPKPELWGRNWVILWRPA